MWGRNNSKMQSSDTAVTLPPMPGRNVLSNAPTDGWQMQNTTSLRGLESLTPLNKIIIDQKINNWEVSKNKYFLLDSNGQKLFHLKENTSFLARAFFGSTRNFVITVYDNHDKPVLTLHRLNCYSLQVKCGERLLGTVSVNSCSCWHEGLEVRDAADYTIFQIQSNFNWCWGLAQFQVLYSNNLKLVGSIKKKRTGFFREVFTNADKFVITFPAELSIEHKVLLIGATILLDFRHFESNLL